RQRVQPGLDAAEVVLVEPELRERLQRGQPDPLRSIGDELLARPARRGDAPAEVVDRLLPEVHVELTDLRLACDGAHGRPPGLVCSVRVARSGPGRTRASPWSTPRVLRSGRASRTAPITTRTKARRRSAPKTPDGTGSPRIQVPAAIGRAFVTSVASPATVSAAPF